MLPQIFYSVSFYRGHSIKSFNFEGNLWVLILPKSDVNIFKRKRNTELTFSKTFELSILNKLFNDYYDNK